MENGEIEEKEKTNRYNKADFIKKIIWRISLGFLGTYERRREGDRGDCGGGLGFQP